MKKSKISSLQEQLMKYLFTLMLLVIFHSQAMFRDHRVYPQMEQMGMNGDFIGGSIPQIQPDGKKIYFAKRLANRVETLIMVRYNADNTLDISFGQNGVASEAAEPNVFLAKTVDRHVTGERVIKTLVESTMDIRKRENDSCLICLEEAKEIDPSDAYLTSCCKKLMCHPCYIVLMAKSAKIKCPNCRSENNLKLVQ